MILSVAIALSISMLIGRAAVDHRISDVQGHTGNTLSVSPAGFFGNAGGGSPLTAADITKIKAVPDVTSVTTSYVQNLTPGSTTSLTSSIPTGGQLGGGNGGNRGFGGFTPRLTVIGTNDPGTALTNTAFGGGTETLTSGSSFPSGSTSDLAIVGSNVASTNSLSVGSTFTAWSTTFRVVGIFSAGTNNFANNNILMPLATVQKLTSGTGDATSATVYVNNAANLSTVQSSIQTALGSTASVSNTNQSIQSSLSTLSSTESTTTYVLWGTIVAAAIILLLSMLMIVRERRREIGVLKAVGASNRSVITQFIAEASTFTVIGAVVGFLLGLVLASPLTNQIYNGNTPSSPTGGFAGRGGFTGGRGPGLGGFGGRGVTHVLSQLNISAGWSTLLFAFLIAVAVAVVGSSVAAATTLRIRPADVLRSE